MRGKSNDPRRARVRKLIEGGESSIPAELPAALKGQATRSGQSVFETAINWASPDQVARAKRVTGPLDASFYVEKYRRTQNPLWLWLNLSDLSKPEEIPPEAFEYLKQVAKQFFTAVLNQLLPLERVRITPGQELQEGVSHAPPDNPAPPDIPEILGLSQPGRNAFQAAARDLQAWSAAIAIEDLVDRTGCSRDEAYAALAIALGRTSPEAGPSTESVRKLVLRGKKLLPRRRTRVSE